MIKNLQKKPATSKQTSANGALLILDAAPIVNLQTG
jgi:hypothetical protein